MNLFNFQILQQKEKSLNLRPKMSYLGTFGLEFEKAVVISEISTLEFRKNEFLTHAVNFGIGSTFSKGPGSSFSEAPGSGTGPLYKV